MKKHSSWLTPLIVTIVVFAFTSIRVDAASFPWYVGPDHSGVDGQNQSVVVEAYRDAAIVGFDKSRQDEAYEAGIKVAALEAQNEALTDQVFDLTLRIQKLEKASERAQNTSQVAPETRIVYVNGSSGDVDLTDLEHRVSVIERVVSMMEVNIGSLYARMDQLLDPVLRALKLK